MLSENIIKRNIVNQYVKYRISTTTCQVTESLGRYNTGKWPVKKIYDPNYDMSGLSEQMEKLVAKVS